MIRWVMLSENQLLQKCVTTERLSLRKGHPCPLEDSSLCYYLKLAVQRMPPKLLRGFWMPLVLLFSFKEQELHITTSIALAPYDGEDAETLLKNADIAMYHAKQQGKTTTSLYRP